MQDRDLNTVMRVLGGLEAKVDHLLAEHETLRCEVEVLTDAAKIAAGIAVNRRKVYARLAAVLLGLASLTTAGTATVSYVANTTHPPNHTRTIVVKQP